MSDDGDDFWSEYIISRHQMASKLYAAWHEKEKEDHDNTNDDDDTASGT